MKKAKSQSKVMLHGGMVRGKGGPTDDKNVRFLPEGASVLPADTTRAVGGPSAVNTLIEATHQPNMMDGGPVHLRALSTKESVLPPDSTQAIGGAPAVKALIDATHTPVAEPNGGRVPLAKLGMMNGGPIGATYGSGLDWEIQAKNRADEMLAEQRAMATRNATAQNETNTFNRQSQALQLERAKLENQELQSRIGRDARRRQDNMDALSFAYRADGEPYVKPLAARAKGARNGDYVGSVGDSWNDEFDEKKKRQSGGGRPAIWAAVLPVGNRTNGTIGGFEDFAGRSILGGTSASSITGGMSARELERRGPQVISKREQGLLLERDRATGGKLPKGELKDEEYYRLGAEERTKYWQDRYKMANGGVVGMKDGGTVSLAQRAKARGLGMASGGAINPQQTNWGPQYLPSLFGAPQDYASYEDYQQAMWNSLTPEQRARAQQAQKTAQGVDAANAERASTLDARLAGPEFAGIPATTVAYLKQNPGMIDTFLANQQAMNNPVGLAGNAAAIQARDASLASAASMDAAKLANRLQQAAGQGPSGDAVYNEQMRQAAAEYQKLTGKPFAPQASAGGGYDTRPPEVIAVEKMQFDRLNQQNSAAAALEAQNRAKLTPQQVTEQQAQGRYLDKPAAPVAAPTAMPSQPRPLASPSATAPARPGRMAAPVQRPDGRVIGPMSLAGRALRRPLPVRGGVIGMANGGEVIEPLPGETEEEYIARLRDAQRVADMPRPAATESSFIRTDVPGAGYLRDQMGMAGDEWNAGNKAKAAGVALRGAATVPLVQVYEAFNRAGNEMASAAGPAVSPVGAFLSGATGIGDSGPTSRPLASRAFDRTGGDDVSAMPSVVVPASGTGGTKTPPPPSYGPGDKVEDPNGWRSWVGDQQTPGAQRTKQYTPGGTVITGTADSAGRVNSFSGMGSKDAGMDPASAAALAKVQDEYNASFYPQNARALAERAVARRQQQAGEQSATTFPLMVKELEQKVEAGEISLGQAREIAKLFKEATDEKLPPEERNAAARRYRLLTKGRDDEYDVKVMGSGVDPTTGFPGPQSALVHGPDGIQIITPSGEVIKPGERGGGAKVVSRADFAVMAKRLGSEEAARKFLESKGMKVE